MAKKCETCEVVVHAYFYCDMDHEGPWCERCFEKKPCRTEHDEGCETSVYDSDPRITEG